MSRLCGLDGSADAKAEIVPFLQRQRCLAVRVPSELHSARSAGEAAAAPQRRSHHHAIATSAARKARRKLRDLFSERANHARGASAFGLKVFPNARSLITRKLLTPKEMLPRVSSVEAAGRPAHAP
ncbi:MAG: hypothetical protein KIT60_18160 [Burkholderiaceae bacterium]|nr:hypothetical protein [Burkholderiaceae bacterium]